MEVAKANNNFVSFLNNKTGKVETVDIRTGEVVSSAPTQTLYSDAQRFGWPLANLIVNKVREGASLASISREPGMPDYSILAAWRRAFPEFDKRLRQARSDRADYLREQAQILVEEANDESNVGLLKFKFNGYMKLAASDAPEEYGGKTTSEQRGAAGPTQIVIYTGIERNKPDIILEKGDYHAENIN